VGCLDGLSRADRTAAQQVERTVVGDPEQPGAQGWGLQLAQGIKPFVFLDYFEAIANRQQLRLYGLHLVGEAKPRIGGVEGLRFLFLHLLVGFFARALAAHDPDKRLV
jgi:hypothetical protein